MIESFLAELDGAWKPDGPSPVRLNIIGSTALMLQADYARGTKDSDVLETAELDDPARTQLLRLGGEGSRLHRRHHIYLEIVGSGLPFLPNSPQFHALPQLHLTHLDVRVLDIVDVVVSKLKPFRAQDLDDIGAMVERDLVPHAQLIARFLRALDVCAHTA